MKYRTEIVIDLPRERVVELMDNSENLMKWQKGLQSFEHLSGEPGQVGATSRMVFDEGGRRIEMIETIQQRDFPDAFVATYEAKGVWNQEHLRFYEENGATRWVADHEFRFSGIMRLLSLVMGRTFRKQSQQFMDDFKRFAEAEGP